MWQFAPVAIIFRRGNRILSPVLHLFLQYAFFSFTYLLVWYLIFIPYSVYISVADQEAWGTNFTMSL